MNLKCVLLCERRQFKEATLDDSNYMAFWKRQKSSNGKKKKSQWLQEI